MNDTELNQNLEKYAEVITKVGVNVQPGQTVVLYASVTQKKLANLITKAAYQLGAAEVILEWNDITTIREFLLNASTTRIGEVFDYEKEKWQFLADKRVNRISIASDDPNALADVDSDRIAKYQAAQGLAKRPIMQVTTNNDISWLVVAAASTEWAELVFPELKGHLAIDALWQAIFKTTLVDQTDPIEAWQAKIIDLSGHAAWLNQHAFTALHYQAPNTDLTVGLPENHIWVAADATDAAGNTFVANIPTEEVFTAPDRRHIDGTIASTKPLSYAGTIIEGIQITFKDGKVVKATATKGETVLQNLIDTDEGAKSLGEISLVPFDSPISQSNITFFNTLFDENASNHMALGSAYPFTIQNGTKMDSDELMKHGMNISQTHVDFMVGSNQMNIDGITSDGSRIPIFRDGNWAE